MESRPEMSPRARTLSLLVFSLHLAWGAAFGSCLDAKYLDHPFRNTVTASFAAYDPDIPPPEKGPPFTQEAQKVYHFLLHGKLGNVPLARASQATKAATFRTLMNSIASRYEGFKNYGPVEV